MSEPVWGAVRTAAIDCGEVIVSGFGEPLLDPGLLERLRELDAGGVRTSFSTNGQRMTTALARSLAQLKCLGAINVSIDSPDPVLYREMRGGILSRAICGLSTLLSELPVSGIVSVSSVATGRNIASLIALPRLLSELGVRTWVLQSLNDWVPNSGEEHILGNGCPPDLFERLQASCRDHGIDLRPTQRHRLKLELAAPEEAHRRFFAPVDSAEGTSRQCTVPWEMPYVDKDGRVFPCCTPAADEPMGNLHDQSLAEIWMGDRFEDFRLGLASGTPLPSRCRSCTAAQAGPHLYRIFAAQVLHQESELSHAHRCTLQVQNVGVTVWKQGSILIGTARPRDRASALANSSWYSLTRVGTFSENWVRPGDTATFELAVTPEPADVPEVFQLVVEGVGWLPDTEFELGPFSTDSSDSAHPLS